MEELLAAIEAQDPNKFKMLLQTPTIKHALINNKFSFLNTIENFKEVTLHLQTPMIKQVFINNEASFHEILLVAIKSGQLEIVKALLQFMNDLGEEDVTFFPTFYPWSAYFLLLLAIESNHPAVLRELLQWKKISETNLRGSAWLLSIATKNGQLEIVRELLQCKAIIEENLARWDCESFFLDPIKSNRLEIVIELLEVTRLKEQALIFSDPRQQIYSSVREVKCDSLNIASQLRQIFQLLEMELTDDIKQMYEQYSLKCSQEIGESLDNHLSEALIKIVYDYASVQVKVVDDGGERLPKPIALEIKKKTETSCLNQQTSQPILLSFLKKCRIPRDGGNLPPPDLAFRRAAAAGFEDVIRGLANNTPLDINEVGAESGRTALHLAVIHRKKNVVSQLIRMGARDITDAKNKRAIDYAREAGDEEIVGIIESFKRTTLP